VGLLGLCRFLLQCILSLFFSFSFLFLISSYFTVFFFLLICPFSFSFLFLLPPSFLFHPFPSSFLPLSLLPLLPFKASSLSLLFHSLRYLLSFFFSSSLLPSSLLSSSFYPIINLLIGDLNKNLSENAIIFSEDQTG
jgi:hypothetical protein